MILAGVGCRLCAVTTNNLQPTTHRTMHYGVIMAGGAGTRLWPVSRADKPKQLINVVRGKSLLQLSYERLRGLLPPEQIYVCTGAAHGKAVLENLPELPRENL